MTWDHPGAGTDYLVDAYTVNYRAATATTPHTQQAATTSPATIEGLANGTAYHVFVTATNTSATREHLATLIVDARCTLPAYADNNHCRPDTGTGTTPANRRPGASTRLQFTAGVDTLHVTWQPNGPQATLSFPPNRGGFG